MRVVFLTGSHRRHAYLASCLAASGALSGLVIEQREAFMPEAPRGLAPQTVALFERHFSSRDQAESRFFESVDLSALKPLNVTKDQLNSTETVDFINALKPDLVLSYGVHKLSNEVLSAITCALKWNIHGGLSPWYRGRHHAFLAELFPRAADDRHDRP